MMTRAKHRPAAKPRRPGRLVRRPEARNGRPLAATRAATRATAATTGGQKIDYTRGRWPMMQSFSATHADYSDQTTSSYYNTLILTQDADGKSLVDLDLSTYPNEEGKALFKYEVVRGTGQTVATGTFATAPIVELTAPTPGDDAFYEFFAWLDKNNNGLRDTGEDVKTLAAQQAAQVVTIKAADNNQTVTKPAAGQPSVIKTIEVTVTSNGKPVPGVSLIETPLNHPVGVSPIIGTIPLTDAQGKTTFDIEVTFQAASSVFKFQISDSVNVLDKGDTLVITIN